MGVVRHALLFALLSFGVCGIAGAQGPDAGLVNQVAGDVSYVGSGGGAGLVQAFMKMRQGDSYSLATGALLKIVYFQNGRQETWRGPSRFRSGAEQSEPLAGAVYEVANLPTGVAQKIQKIPELLQMAKLGGIQVRGTAPRQRASLEQQAEVAAARSICAQMRQHLSQDDITPELYLFAVLQENLLYDEMKTVADEMLRKQPANQEAQRLAEWAKVRTQPSR
jgi:hypothetical protein